jgi:exopolyphosphatase/guanosine-5'-triphosphate,3'-diphosphate pyrophosphatase
MTTERPSNGVGAAVDIGSYSVHLLVADVVGHEVRPRFDDSAFLGLGRTIDEEGGLASARAPLVEALTAFVDRATSLGASTVGVVGTDPLRRAPDAADVIEDVRSKLGLEIAVLDHDEEAALALLGAQDGYPVTRETVMVDVGGGSTEILVAGPGRAPSAVGLPLGATRLTGVHVTHDPPREDELAALQAEVDAVMASAPPARPEQLTAVGGTARSLLRIGPPLANRVLTLSRIHNSLDLLAADDAQTIADRHGVRLSRAKVLAAGAAILIGGLERYQQDRLRVADGGLREAVPRFYQRLPGDAGRDQHGSPPRLRIERRPGISLHSLPERQSGLDRRHGRDRRAAPDRLADDAHARATRGAAQGCGNRARARAETGRVIAVARRRGC